MRRIQAVTQLDLAAGKNCAGVRRVRRLGISRVSRGWLIAAALTGCASNSANDPCATSFAGIDQGVAGVVTYTSDVGNQPDMPVADREVMFGGMAATSDAKGQFAIALDPGDYMTSGANENVSVHVDAGRVVRVDLHLGFGSWWGVPATCTD